MGKHLKNIELFLKGSNFYRGIRLTFAVVAPIIFLSSVGLSEIVPAIVVGTFLSAPGDIPGSLKRKVNTILISIVLTMLITTLFLFLKPYFILLTVAVGITSFAVSLLSVYGFRASLVSFSGLLAMILTFAIDVNTNQEIIEHILLMGIGGAWYLFVSFIFQKISPKKDKNQLLSDTLLLIGNYLELRAKLLNSKNEREQLTQQTLVLQTQINEKHEVLREALLTGRKRTGLSRFHQKQLLIFISTVNIFELIEAKQLNYVDIDRVFSGKKKYIQAAENLNSVMGKHLIKLSELIIQNNRIPKNDDLLEALADANKAITSYIDDVQLPKAREGALILKNLYDYQELLIEEVRAIRRAMANVSQTSKVILKRQEVNPFLTAQDYHPTIYLQNLSFNSNLFRHALRFTVAMVFAFVLGSFLDIHNTYWILLTILVIIRPNYGLTKERFKDRLLGTLIGAVFAISIVYVTQSVVVYAVLSIVSLIFAFALIQENYKSAAAFVTINVVFVYALLEPNALEVIQYRVVNTALGAIIAITANYLLWPSWEVYNLKGVLLDAIKKNKVYLEATKELYHNKNQNQLAYKVARKEAFLAISNLNAAFQHLSQDPKSKQKEFQLAYNLVTLNQTIVSATASIGSFIINNKTTPASVHFDVMISKIIQTLHASCEQLKKGTQIKKIDTNSFNAAQDKMIKAFKNLSTESDKNYEKGEVEANQKTLYLLQEAYLISNQLVWLKSLSENLKKSTLNYSKILKAEVDN